MESDNTQTKSVQLWFPNSFSLSWCSLASLSFYLFVCPCDDLKHRWGAGAEGEWFVCTHHMVSGWCACVVPFLTSGLSVVYSYGEWNDYGIFG